MIILKKNLASPNFFLFCDADAPLVSSPKELVFCVGVSRKLSQVCDKRKIKI